MSVEFPPCVHYFCADDPSTDPTTFPKSLLAYHLFPLSRLYYCEECRALRSPRQVIEEIACYYCPNCLFEVTSSSVKAEKNRCVTAFDPARCWYVTGYL